MYYSSFEKGNPPVNLARADYFMKGGHVDTFNNSEKHLISFYRDKQVFLQWGYNDSKDRDRDYYGMIEYLGDMMCSLERITKL